MKDKIHVVDDQKSICMLLTAMLADAYEVESFPTAEDCLQQCLQGWPELFLLDVNLPGIDGYDLCRRIRATPGGDAIPVLFISSCDSLADVLAGYDAGADDYVLKPFEEIGLQRKVAQVLRHYREKQSLQDQARCADDLVSLLQASLDENALLIRFLRSLAECETARAVVDAALRVMADAGLEGAVQIRMRDSVETFSDTGEGSPMAVAVIGHVRNLERIFEFKRCSVYNFSRISILLNNMPVEDAERCGRIRDSYAIIAESADARLAAIQAAADKAMIHHGIRDLIDDLEAAVKRYTRCHDEARYHGSLHTSKLADALLAVLAHLGLTVQQEEQILDMVRSQSDKLVELYDFTRDTSADFSRLSEKLAQVLHIAGTTPQTANPSCRP
jgi:DNA-binding response OmpR family regulator